MKHARKCQKCGSEYVPESEAHVPHEHPCDSCGAELYDSPSKPEEESSEDEHPIEKGLRKLTDEITGDKRKV